MRRIIARGLVLTTPLLLFAALLLPYSWLNHQVLIHWLGCSCPRVDALGNLQPAGFNANDFTALFWLLVSLGATALAWRLSRRIPGQRTWLRLLYIAGVLALSLLLARELTLHMLWK